MTKRYLKGFYFKITIYIIIFGVIFIGYIFILNYFSKKIISKVEIINELRTKLEKLQTDLSKEGKAKTLNKLIEQKSKKDIQTLSFIINNNLNKSQEEIRAIFTEKFKSEKWNLENIIFNEPEKRLLISFNLPFREINKFYNFILDSTVVFLIDDLKLNKESDNYLIELNLKLNK